MKKRELRKALDGGVVETSARSTEKRLTRSGDGGVEDMTGARKVAGEVMRMCGKTGVETGVKEMTGECVAGKVTRNGAGEVERMTGEEMT